MPDIYGWDKKSKPYCKWIEVEYIEVGKMPPKKEILNFVKKMNLYSDAEAFRHWGKNSKGQYKIVDFGIIRSHNFDY